MLLRVTGGQEGRYRRLLVGHEGGLAGKRDRLRFSSSVSGDAVHFGVFWLVLGRAS